MNIFEQNQNTNPEDFYASLKEKLEDTHDFPEDYLFKFIVNNEPTKLIEIYKIFDGTQHTLSNRDSKNGKYTSLSFNTFVLDADQVIRIYQEVAKVEGVMML